MGNFLPRNFVATSGGHKTPNVESGPTKATASSYPRRRPKSCSVTLTPISFGIGSVRLISRYTTPSRVVRKPSTMVSGLRVILFSLIGTNRCAFLCVQTARENRFQPACKSTPNPTQYGNRGCQQTSCATDDPGIVAATTRLQSAVPTPPLASPCPCHGGQRVSHPS